MLKRIRSNEVFLSLFSTFLMALQFPLIGISLRYLSSAQAAILEAVFVSIYCWIAYQIKKNDFGLMPSKAMMMSGTTNALGLILLFEALARLHPGVVGLIGRLYFVYAMMIAFTYFAEKPDRWDILNICIAILGVFLISVPKEDFTQQDLIGCICATLYPAFFAIQNAIVKARSDRTCSNNLLFNTKFYAVIPLSIYLLMQPDRFSTTSLWSGVGMIAITALGSTFFGLYLFFQVMRTASFSVANLMKVTEPLFVMILSALFFPVKLEYANVIGIVFILSSVAITVLRPKKTHLAKV